MENEFKSLGFAGAVSQSRSVQALVRVLNLFAGKYQGGCTLSLTRGTGDGVEINFGASDEVAGSRGLDEFLDWLAMTDRLILLEAMISNLRDRGVPGEWVSPMIEEAHGLVKSMYPDAKIIEGPHDEKA